jgi:hypothetical protein
MHKATRPSTYLVNVPRRGDYRAIIPTAPIRTQQEVAEILGMTKAQVTHHERMALSKIRAALIAYGYKDPNA